MLVQCTVNVNSGDTSTYMHRTTKQPHCLNPLTPKAKRHFLQIQEHRLNVHV